MLNNALFSEEKNAKDNRKVHIYVYDAKILPVINLQNVLKSRN
jgi:hypothetical protein